MYFRFVRESKLIDIVQEIGIPDIDPEFQPSYNIAPT